MTVQLSVCPKCGTTDKRKNGKCKYCANANALKWRLANPEKFKANTAAYKAKNKEKVRAGYLAWESANKERKRAVTAAWTAKNKEKVKSNNKKYYTENLARIRARTAQYRSENREKISASNSLYIEKNPGKIKIMRAAWKEANPDAKRIQQQNRRSRAKAAGGVLSKGLAAKLFKMQKGLCPCCKQPLGSDYHLDHRMPLALGGSNSDDNMQLLRSTCNQQKHAKDPIDFMQSRGFLL